MNAVINKPRAKKGNVAPVPVQPAEPDHPSVVVGKALTDLVKQIQEAYDSSSSLTNESCMHAHTLIEMVSEMLLSIVEGKAAEEDALIYRIAACLACALAHDREDAPSATLRHKKLKEAYDLAESASISYGFCEEPCVGLAHGIAAGRAVGAAVGTRDPLHGHTPAQASIVFGFIATRANAARQYCSGSTDSEFDQNIAADMFEQIGIAADQMIGGEIVGTPADWMIGHNFHQAGKEVQG